MASDRHIIHKLILDIEVPNKAMADSASEQVVQHIYNDLLPKMERFFDELSVKDHVFINALTLDLGQLNLAQMQGFSEELILALQSKLEKENPGAEEEPVTTETYTEPEKAYKTFYYFLQNGKLPWFASRSDSWITEEKEWIALLEKWFDSAGKKFQLKAFFKTSGPAVARLFSQFSEVFHVRLIEILNNLSTGSLQSIIERSTLQPTKRDISAKSKISKLTQTPLSRESKIAFYKTALLDETTTSTADIKTQAGKRKPVIPPFKQKLEKVKKLPDIIRPKESKSEAEVPAEKEGLFVQQAGLVLLHPFLGYFFKDFGLLTNADFTDEPARQLAVHLLHYLATGKNNAAEHDLTFEKFLCVWPVDQPIERFVAIPQRMLDEAENLLKAAIGHWTALKNTSPDGLREGFLIRSGKLLINEDPVTLVVEKSGIDILLSSLPWGLGVIKLPWMPKPFYVDWQ